MVVSGTVTNGGTLFASGSGSLVEIASGAVVNGGIAEVGNGIVEIKSGSNESVDFLANGSGGLQLDGTGAAYTGKVTGFGGTGGANISQYIDFSQIGSAGATFSYTSANAADTSGTLTVTSGGISASVVLVGHYTSANFQTHSGAGGSLEITDPITIFTTPLTVKGGATSGAITGDMIAENIVTVSSGGTLAAENDNNLVVFGTLTNGGLAEALSGGDINLLGAIANTGQFEALSGGAVTAQGAVTNAANGLIEEDAADLAIEGNVSNAGQIGTVNDGLLSMEQSVSNTGTISAAGDGLMTLGGFRPASDNITNKDMISATAESTVVMGVGGFIVNSGEIQATSDAVVSMTTGSGLINWGAIVTTGDAATVVQGGGAVTNLGAISADGAGFVELAPSVINFGTILASGASGGATTATVLMGNVTNGGILEVAGNGVISATGTVSGGAAVFDGRLVGSGAGHHQRPHLGQHHRSRSRWARLPRTSAFSQVPRASWC